MISEILIWSGGSLLFLVLMLGGPLAGYVLARQRRVSTTRFLATLEHKEIVPALKGSGDLMESTGVIDMPEIGESLFAEQYFAEDPLFSHSLPRDLDMSLPIADETFDALAAEAKLTGAGVNIDAEWREWGMLLEEDLLVPA